MTARRKLLETGATRRPGLSSREGEMTIHEQPVKAPDRFLSEKQVADLTSLGRMTIHRMRRAGTFPQPLRLSEGRIAYWESEVLDWMKQRQRLSAAG